MGSVALEGFGSGGAGLNFKVVGNPQPANPKENTIWVETDVDITSWIFSATEPAAAEEGMVWIITGTSSQIEFNALKKNGIQVYPLSAKQYVGGAWVDKTAKSYQGGEWIEWIPHGLLYRYGYDNLTITGGIKIVEGISDASYSPGTGTKNSESITLRSSASQCITAKTQKLVDLTEFKKITLNVLNVVANNSSYFADFGVSKSPSDATVIDTGNVVARKAIGTTGTIELDVSSLTGGYCLFVSARSWNDQPTSSVTFTEWWCK